MRTNRYLLGMLALTFALIALPAAASAQGGSNASSPLNLPPVMTVSQSLQQLGHTLSPDEIAFFDADEVIQTQYMQALVTIDLLARTAEADRNDEWRQNVLTALNQVANMDPSAAPSAPSALARLRELAVAQRTHYRNAARAWLTAFQANDAQWSERGTDEMLAGLQDLYRWQEALSTRYPRPQQQDQR